MSLEPSEIAYLESRLGRSPGAVERHIVAAEWSEHCSYKSSKKHLRMLPTDGPLVITGRGYDSGVLDAGDGYVITAHIESHNHPSAVEPYGGAATGVGGVIRDILSSGTRPIAILDGLRFGDASADPKSRWLFRNVVRGIADYGNCIGVPTIGGEIEFDKSYRGYAMVDVAAIGFGRRDRLIQNRAEPGDAVMLLGGSTGRDGIGGSQFASDPLETDEDRSAVQIPDPFMEKLLIEAVIEARNAGVIRAMKDLGGGGLSCAVSETADSLGVGIEMDASAVHAREPGMSAEEIMTSESQERMLIITDADDGRPRLEGICARLGVPCSAIGTVRADGIMRVRMGNGGSGGSGGSGTVVAEMEAGVVANARLLDLPSTKPAYLEGIESYDHVQDMAVTGGASSDSEGHTDTLYRLMTSPNMASRAWAYGQYDHEVGIRTVVRPGADAAVLRLDNGRHLAVSMDGNPKHCYINPRNGAMGCFEEACRNVVCTGATPAGMLDHLQFGDPTDPEIFWTFMESLRGISDFAVQAGIPCIGGKVSLYNETAAGPIKPTPVIAVLGLTPGGGDDGGSKGGAALQGGRPAEGDHIVLVGTTRHEMGGSEYYEYIRGIVGGRCPAVDVQESRRNSAAILGIIREGLTSTVHDCSKGGAAAAVSEVCLAAEIGCAADLGPMPRAERDRDMPDDVMMFSESHSRYVAVIPDRHMARAAESLAKSGARYARIGRMGGERIIISISGSTIADLSVDKTRRGWSSTLKDVMHNDA